MPPVRGQAGQPVRAIFEYLGDARVQVRDAQLDNNAVFGEQPAPLVGKRGAGLDLALPPPVQRQQRLLLRRLDRYQAHARPRCRFTYQPSFAIQRQRGFQCGALGQPFCAQLRAGQHFFREFYFGSGVHDE